jgi:hypothetical protein
MFVFSFFAFSNIHGLLATSNKLELSVISGRDKNSKYVGAVFYHNSNKFFQAQGYGDNIGINFAVLHPVTGQIEGVKNFDNWYSPESANEAMVNFMDAVPDGHIILAAIADEGSNIKEETYNKIESIGSKHIRDVRYWDSWAMITKKGASKNYAERHTPRSAPCVIKVLVPLSDTNDHNPPGGSFSINKGALATKNSEVTLDLSRIRDSSSGMGNGARMEFSNDGIFWSTPEFISSIKKWYLERGNGPKIVFARFSDVDGNWNTTSKTKTIRLKEEAGTVITTAAWPSPSKYEAVSPADANDLHGNIYIVWRQFFKQLGFNSSRDGGRTWLAEPKLIFSGDGVQEPRIACDSKGHLSVIWATQQYDYNTGNTSSEINVMSSYSYGNTWKSIPHILATNVSKNIRLNNPNIACDNRGHIYAVWSLYNSETSNESYSFTYSNDYGINWQTQNTRINKNTIVSWLDYEPPRILCDNQDHVYVVWPGKSGGIYSNHSNDHGATWQNSDVAVTHKRYGARGLTFIQSYDHLFIAWTDWSKIYLQRSSDHGVTWLNKNVEVSGANSPGGPVPGHILSMSSDHNGNVYLAWTESRMWQTYPSKWEVYFNKSGDFGSTWNSRALRIAHGDDNEISAYSPLLSCDNSGGVNIIWYDDRNFNKNNDLLRHDLDCFKNNLYFNYSKDYGATWLKTDIRLDRGYHAEVSHREAFGSTFLSGKDSNVFTIWEECSPHHSSDGNYLYSIYCDIRRPRVHDR